MTKTEVKEYLSKIYNVPVLKVMTANLLGKWKRLYGKRKIISYKRRNIKRVEVEFKTTNDDATSTPKIL
jgi:large subunit ribosomal protein L23